MKDHGFTLIELLFTLFITALLTFIALPGMYRFLARSGIEQAMAQFSTALSQARFYAVSHQQQVVLCPSSVATRRCLDQWQDPILVFVDTNGDQQYQQGEWVILQRQLFADIHVYSHGKARLTYQPQGYVNMARGFTFCDRNDSPAYARRLTISKQGRVKISADGDHDGFDEWDGESLVCQD